MGGADRGRALARMSHRVGAPGLREHDVLDFIEAAAERGDDRP